VRWNVSPRADAAGLASHPRTTYLQAIMSVLRHFSIPRAYRDVRRFMLTRKVYELWFLLAAMAVTMLILIGFLIDSNIKPEYHENIIYVQNWRADRSEAEILAQQKLDAAKKAKQDAEIEQAEKKRQAEFQKLQNATAPWL
jgi:hypothetical protein